MSIDSITYSPHLPSGPELSEVPTVSSIPAVADPGPATLAPDPELTKAFLREVCGTACPGHLVLCTAPPGNDKDAPLTTRWCDATDLVGAAAFAARQVGHVWFAGGPQRERLYGGKRGGSKTVVAIFGVWSDVDVLHAVHKKTDLPPTLAAAMTLINRVGLTPTVVVDTGHGLQPYWLFHEPLVFTDDDHRHAVQELLNQFKATVAGYAAEKTWSVDAVADLARLMRLPGTLNVKEPENPRPVRIHAHHPECRYTIEQIRAVIKVNEQSLLQVSPAEPAPTVTEESNGVAADAQDTQDEDRDLRDLSTDCALLAKARAARNGKTFDEIWGGSDAHHGGDTSKADMSLLVRLAFWTRKDAAQIDRMFRASGRWRLKWDEKHFANGDTYGRGSITKAIARTTKVYDPQSAATAADDDAGADDGVAAVSVAMMGPPVPLDSRRPPELPMGVFGGWLSPWGEAARPIVTPRRSYPQMKIEMRPIGQIKPYPQNPRVNDAAVDAVVASLKEFGWRQAIVVDGETSSSSVIPGTKRRRRWA